jgi:sialic acid synthase SpsE
MTLDFTNSIEDIASTYTNDTIFIIGKGPSVDQIDPLVFNGSLVIAMNDAERIVPADLSIFYSEWAAKSVRENGFKSRGYVAPFSIAGHNQAVIRWPHAPLNQESSNLLMQRFQAGEAVIEDVLFFSALQIARKVAAFRNRPQTVYMVGLDFEVSSKGPVYSDKISVDYAVGDDSERRRTIEQQEFYLLNALYVLKGSELDVRHVGTRAFSALTSTELNAIFVPRASQNKKRGLGSVDVTAELTTNHFGDRSRLERMIRAAAAADADYIKLQKRDVDSFYTKDQLAAPYVSPFGKTFGDYRRQLELNAEDFAFVDKLCKSLGIKWFASILDKKSFQFVHELGLGMVKLPSTISEHKDYLQYVADNYTGVVVLSTGMTNEAYEKWVLDQFRNCEKLVLMQANSAYPTPAHDCNVAVVRRYHELSLKNQKIVPAYSSHDFGWFGSALAVAAGARMVEKHVKLGNTEWAHFDAVAVDLATPDFKSYVEKMRETEEIVGSGIKQVNESEFHKYRIQSESAET